MARMSALKVVESKPFERTLDLGSTEGAPHSLHAAVSYPRQISPEVVRFLLKAFSKPGESVLDPFCGVGVVPFEAALCRRVPLAVDIDPLAVLYSRAKITPVDLAEVTLALQMVPLHRPVSSADFVRHFAPFYDVNTFRELVNLRRILQKESSETGDFLSLLIGGILHGKGGGSLSAQSHPAYSLSPREQSELNESRRQLPDYRALVPRVIRRAAHVLRDGAPSFLRIVAEEGYIGVSDARDLGDIDCGEVGLVITRPPLPGEGTSASLDSSQWLRSWFHGLEERSWHRELGRSVSVRQWLGFMNEVLLELARVVRRGGRVALYLKDLPQNRSAQPLKLHELIVDMVEDELSQYFIFDGVYEAPKRADLVTGRARVRTSAERVLVLRR